MQDPSVAVVMAAYNSSAFIHHGIESFLAQTYKNCFLYICDDGSKDDTRRIAMEYAAKHPNIIVIYNEPNAGYVATMNRLFAEANTDYICILDSDDRMTPDRVAHQLEVIKKYGADAVISEYIHTDGKDDFNYIVPKYEVPTHVQANSADVISASGSLMMSKKVQQKVIGYDVYFSDAFCADNYFITKISEHFKLYYDPAHVYYYVQMSGSMTQVFNLYKLSKQTLVGELIATRELTGTDMLEQGDFEGLEKRRTAIMSDKKWLSRNYQAYAARYIDQKMLKEGIKMAFKAVLLNPTNAKSLRTLGYGIKRLIGTT